MSLILDNIIQHLHHANELHEHTLEAQLTEPLRALQHWQTKRLLATHQDLWQNKRFRPAMGFFIDELYGPKDFSQRDQELARVVPKMAKIIPKQALESLEAALRLNSLSLALDIALTEHLNAAPVNRESYALAYVKSDNQAQREEQIVLLERLGVDLADVVKIKGISTLLMLSRKPAKMAGVESLHQFLESGFKAFKKLGNVDEFIQPIITRERALKNALFAQQVPNPLPEFEA
ncbi:FFLEELY motif protein [Aliiglaciecola aliphaticivorans]